MEPSEAENPQKEILCVKPKLNRTVLLKPRSVKLSTRTGTSVNRILPNANQRRISAWIFLDHFGPHPQTEESMQVARHPHTGLQTVTWLLEGSVEHADSEQNTQHIEPGQLNLMTAGRGIAHSELSISKDQTPFHGNMHGVQLWTALPNDQRNSQPFFEHYENLPSFTHQNLNVHLFMGELLGNKSPATTFTPLLGAELTSLSDDLTKIPLNPDFEYGVMPLTKHAVVNNELTQHGEMLAIETGNHELTIQAEPQTKLLILGGEPFTEEIVMWWNFVARSQKEIEEMRENWNAQKGWVPDFKDKLGGWIPAPPMPNVTLKAR